jgi:hypothetical protein
MFMSHLDTFSVGDIFEALFLWTRLNDFTGFWVERTLYALCQAWFEVRALPQQ